MAARSRLQREVLSLYRQLLRAGKDKPGSEQRIREEFRRHAGTPAGDSLRLEFLLRRGRRQLEQLRAASTKRLSAFGRAAAGAEPRLRAAPEEKQALKRGRPGDGGSS
ncbi:succinate dehydrogenase assembly factor 1, mitochondrial [Struthio camelus]|uniref:succinate dehydrogenase assembly factor 1, mitochondrial n=1 Tax=Struthio camelus TaxID=8801 RepID=UPI003603F8C1